MTNSSTGATIPERQMVNNKSCGRKQSHLDQTMNQILNLNKKDQSGKYIYVSYSEYEN